MDIYINYGDSRRIIECASGMEKMISSLAIRVALINVSSLPKSDILILDDPNQDITEGMYLVDVRYNNGTFATNWNENILPSQVKRVILHLLFLKKVQL